MTPKDLINQVFQLLLKRDATDEEVASAIKLVNDFIAEVEKEDAT